MRRGSSRYSAIEYIRNLDADIHISSGPILFLFLFIKLLFIGSVTFVTLIKRLEGNNVLQG